MKNHALSFFAIAFALLGTLPLFGCIGINQDVVIGDGETVSGNQSTINGTIRVGKNADVRGTLSTVNGSAQVGEGSRVASVQTVNGRIELARGAEAEELETVNGRISLGQDTHVRGDLATINGIVTLHTGSRVDGEVATINGKITLDGAEAGSIVNFNGGMELKNGSVVRGELRVRRPNDPDQTAPAKIIIGPNSRVLGELIFEREVELHVHESADIGAVTGAEPTIFTGDQP